MLFRAKNIYRALTPFERRLIAGCLVVAAVSGFFLALEIFETLTTETPKAGGSFTEGLVGQPTYLNPIISGSSDADRDLMELLYSDLAEMIDNLKSGENGRVFNAYLKDNIFWQDGERITSDDVVFTVETVKNPDAYSPLLNAWQGVDVQRISELEVKFTLRAPYTFFADNLKKLKIAPKHIFGSIPPANLRLSAYNLEPVSSGPFKFSSYEKRRDGFISAYSLEVNEKYWAKKPFIEKFAFRFFSDETSLIEAFNSREADAISGLNPKNLNRLARDKNVITLRMPRYYAVFLNQSAHQALKERGVREALSLAADKSSLLEKVFAGEAMASNGPIPPDLDGYDSSIYNRRFSNEEAAASLEKSGWILDNDSVRSKTIAKEKVRLELSLLVPQTGFLIETANLLAEDWAKIGVRVNPTVLDAGKMAEAIKNRRYEMILFGNVLYGNADLFSFWHSSEKFYPGLNLALYDNKKVDDLIEKIRQNQNKEARARDTEAALRLIENDAPAVFLFSPNYLYVVKKQLAGPSSKFATVPSDRFENIADWYLETSRTLK